MLQSVLNLSYLAGSLTFILGLKMLSNPATARKGNWLAAAGMAVAIAGTIFLYKDDNGSALGNYGWIFGGLIIGIVESLVAGYLDPYVGGGTKDFAPYVLMIIVLMIKPYGIFGKRRIERV